MSDVEATPGKSLAWTDEAKLQFLMRIIAQFTAKGDSPNLSSIYMEGRTLKALQNQWTKVKKDALNLTGDTGNGEMPVRPKSTPRKPPRAKAAKKLDDIKIPQGDDDDKEVTPGIKDDDDDGPQTPNKSKPPITPRKRKAPATPKKRVAKAANEAKKRKLSEARVEHSDNEEEIDAKHEDSPEMEVKDENPPEMDQVKEE